MEKEYEEMNRLHRLDGFEYDVIKAVAVFSQEDYFWQQNIRSVSKFRIKFEELLIKAQAEIKRREKYKIIEI
jgi:predicted house-cleaning NTP pyrophosphatase (Maf/HAM1 superfamily)